MKKLTLSVLAMAFTAGVSFGQLRKVNEEALPSEDYIPSSRLEQHEAFLDGEYKLPAKPRNMWTFGIEGGYDQINGDVDPNLGWDAGINFRKALGYATSIRIGGLYLKPKGEDEASTPSRLIDEGNAKSVRYEKMTGRDLGPNTANGAARVWTYEHQFEQKAILPYAEFVLNLNNINFHREQNKWNFELGAGPAAYMFNTATTFKNVRSEGRSLPDVTLNIGNSEDTRQDILGDGDDLNNDKYDIVPAAMFSAGISRRLGERAAITFRPRYIRTWDDFLDGEAYHDTSFVGPDDAGFSPDKDQNFAANVALDFDLGSKAKRTQPLWWQNPLPFFKDDFEFDGDYLFEDTDGDGVIDRLDKEPNSPCNFVDGGGVAIDSDKDGIVDCKDACPFTPAAQVSEIDANGCTPKPEDKNCCDDVDELRRKVNELEKRKPVIKEVIKEVKVQSAPVVVDPCPALSYPSVTFGKNSKYVAAGQNSQISAIASQLSANPSCRIVVEGFATGRRKVAQQVAWARAKAVADKLANTYGISRDRIIVRFSGVDGYGDVVMVRSARAGEYGSSNPAAPFPGN